METFNEMLASLESALTDWVHGRLDDDIALILVEYTGSTAATVAGPSWELDSAD